MDDKKIKFIAVLTLTTLLVIAFSTALGKPGKQNKPDNPRDIRIFDVTFPASGSDLYSDTIFTMIYDPDRRGSRISGWTNEKSRFQIYDSTPESFTLWSNPRNGYITRVSKYTTKGSIVWRMTLEYVDHRLNIYAGGPFGSDSTWSYNQPEDSWTIHFLNTICEEYDLNTGQFTCIGQISFTMLILEIPNKTRERTSPLG